MTWGGPMKTNQVGEDILQACEGIPFRAASIWTNCENVLRIAVGIVALVYAVALSIGGRDE